MDEEPSLPSLCDHKSVNSPITVNIKKEVSWHNSGIIPYSWHIYLFDRDVVFPKYNYQRIKEVDILPRLG